MKKVVKLSLILLITVFMMGSVYAALSCEISAKASKTEVNKNEEFSVDFNIANIQSQRGVISLGATLEYDKDSLELVKMEGKNGWETPAEGASYNQSNGKIAITRGGVGKDDEIVFTATFKPKEASKENVMVTLKNITVADGTAPAKIKLAYQTITIKEGTPNPMPQPPEDDNNNNNNNNTTDNNTNTDGNINIIGNTSTVNGNKNNTNKNVTTNTVNKNAMNKGNLPKAGDTTTMIFVILILMIALVAGIFFIKIKIINKEIDKQ